MDCNYEMDIWGDNWYIDNEKAWFVCGQQNILCSIDLKTRRCELTACIPDISFSKFRVNSFCIKYQQNIFCMPRYGKSIWVYDITSGMFDEIYINNPNKVSIFIQYFGEYDNKIYAVSQGLGKIIEIDPVRKKIDKYYDLCEEGAVIHSIKLGTVIYGLIGSTGEICQFDLSTEEVITYKLPDVGRKFKIMCFDGRKFWLGGNRKEIYVWDKEGNQLDIIDRFPKEYGVYEFTKESTGDVDLITDEYAGCTFSDLVTVGDYIWLIPFCTNKIMYINKEADQLYTFEIDEENETRDSILRRTSLCYKYILEYVKDERYIGLYSIKNNRILEIDTSELKYEYKRYEYHISTKCIKEYKKLCDNVFHEKNAWEREIYRLAIQLKENSIQNIDTDKIGIKIYKG